MSSGRNIAMSLAWPFVLLEQSLHLLPLSVALAIVAALEDMGLKQVQIKWPNDVYVQGKKIAGILMETQPVKNAQVNDNVIDGKYVAVVIGLGLNYEMLNCEQVKSDKPLVLTDICEQLQLQGVAEKPAREIVASELLNNVIAVCQSFKQTSLKNLEKFRTSYDFCKQKEVEIILDNNERLFGLAQGVSDNAELLVLIDGELHSFNSAEVSVRAGNAAGVS